MSGGFKWLEVGLHHVIADEEDGRIIAHILINNPKQPNQPIHPVKAYVDGKEIGVYLNEKYAREAVEDFIADTHRKASV